MFLFDSIILFLDNSDLEEIVDNYLEASISREFARDLDAIVLVSVAFIDLLCLF